MKHRKRWLIGILVFTAVALWIRGLTIRPTHSVSQPTPVPLSLSKSDHTVRPEPVEGHSRRISTSAEWGGNPFEKDRSKTPIVTAVSEPADYRLSGIIWDPKAPSAIVNNRMVSVGDHIGPWKVEEISKTEVILSDGVSTQKLSSNRH